MTRTALEPDVFVHHSANVMAWQAVSTMVGVFACASAVYVGGIQPVEPLWLVAAIPLGIFALIATQLLGYLYVNAADRRTFLHPRPTGGIFAMPQVRSRWLPAQVLLWGAITPVVLVYVLFTVLDPWLRSVTNIAATVVGEDRSAWYTDVPAAWMALTIFAGVVVEEIVFRGPGILLWQLRDRVESRYARIALSVTAVVGGGLLSAVGFGYFHSSYGAWNVLIAATFGFLFYPLVLATKSLWPAIIGHFVWNLDSFRVLPWIH
ncbi:CPBP family intramembrane glutamic endopeptidase [Rhodococcus sp. AQ5-07]|uniref:CPBP family intramembrane glutamic endopeptidase n=1 Tax=Rhodococcus sp. AQ5-07 TaxID=2054902 RepID=UPI000DC001AD|nr:CPBP family intramembrane glutamic endopeptidase [Rhodococcus sp. AQ5-07]RAL31015.1 hypothetical protein CVN56_29995 [Rhodococcus sp. AQ5-07]